MYSENRINEISQISKAIGEVYTRLTNGLQEITGKNGWEVLYDMGFSTYLECETVDDLMEMEGDICPYNIQNGINGKVFVCACGKKHIQKLSVMEYRCQKPNPQKKDFKYIIIGSKCIHTLTKFVKDIEDIDDFKKKIFDWELVIKEEERKHRNNKCVCCGKYNIQKNYKYKKEQRKFWCRDCCSGDYVKCVKCKKFRLYQKTSYDNKPMKFCPPCWFGSS
jgi:hypothetical protein